jgi:hypothetical protein
MRPQENANSIWRKAQDLLSLSPMLEPSVRTSRLAIAGGLAAVIVVGGAGFILGRGTAAPAPEPATPVAIATPAPTPSPSPENPSLLDRAALIALAGRAADAFASGDPMPATVTDAADRRFDLLLPFGCAGPTAEGSKLPLRWRYEEARQTLRLHVETTEWQASEWNVDPKAGSDAIRGFWVTRPWSSSGACPSPVGQAMATGIEPITLPGQTLAIAQFRASAERRDDHAFTVVQRTPAATIDTSRGFRVRLTGRIARLPGGGPVRCVQPGGIEQRPICVIAASVDEVRIENAANGAVLGTWNQRARSSGDGATPTSSATR